MNRNQAETAAAALAKADPSAAFAHGIALLNADYPELLLDPAQLLAERHSDDARLAQMLGLAARAAGDGPLAYRAFARAAALAPRDPLIAHSHARTVLEAGKPAVDLFQAARNLAAQDGTILQGLSAALVAENRATEAVDLLDTILRSNPLWVDGHSTLAQIGGQYGRDATASIDGALIKAPTNPELHRLRVDTLLKSRRIAEASAAVAGAVSALGEQDWLFWYRGHVASELGEIERADAAFASAAPPSAAADVALLARHAIRAGRPEQCVDLIEPWLERQPSGELWPYAALAWRLTGDPRAQWLEGEPSLVGVYDLADRMGNLDALATKLRALHMAKQAPLDQSVRRGTQTDGNLLLRDDPAIQHLRGVLLETVANHIASLPPSRPAHPTLIDRREPQRVAGSWSVRLTDAGYHSDHIHSHGWLSSAFYVALPDSMSASHDITKPGWLSLGECRDLVPTLLPRQLVEPKPGRLVLFPSTMWHGTRPFPAGERLTVAFDIARPKQD